MDDPPTPLERYRGRARCLPGDLAPGMKIYKRTAAAALSVQNAAVQMKAHEAATVFPDSWLHTSTSVWGTSRSCFLFHTRRCRRRARFLTITARQKLSRRTGTGTEAWLQAATSHLEDGTSRSMREKMSLQQRYSDPLGGGFRVHLLFRQSISASKDIQGSRGCKVCTCVSGSARHTCANQNRAL